MRGPRLRRGVGRRRRVHRGTNLSIPVLALQHSLLLSSGPLPRLLPLLMQPLRPRPLPPAPPAGRRPTWRRGGAAGGGGRGGRGRWGGAPPPGRGCPPAQLRRAALHRAAQLAAPPRTSGSRSVGSSGRYCISADCCAARLLPQFRRVLQIEKPSWPARSHPRGFLAPLGAWQRALAAALRRRAAAFGGEAARGAFLRREVLFAPAGVDATRALRGVSC